MNAQTDISIVKRSQKVLAQMYADYQQAVHDDHGQFAGILAANIRDVQQTLHEYRAGKPTGKLLEAIAIAYGV